MEIATTNHGFTTPSKLVRRATQEEMDGENNVSLVDPHGERQKNPSDG
jgi:hypothetical protein